MVIEGYRGLSVVIDGYWWLSMVIDMAICSSYIEP